jgi:G:T-mismatch repair DNA endonuclease (very short patch repair protein)
MRANRRANTTPELALRSELQRLGLRFRKDLPLRQEVDRTHSRRCRMDVCAADGV